MDYTYILYVDVLVGLLAANLFFDYLLLWATGEVTGQTATMARLTLGALMGTVYFFLVYFSRLGLIPGYGLLHFPPMVIAVAAAMVFYTFRPKPWRKFASLMGFFIGIGLIAGGAGLAAAYLTGNGSRPNVLWGTVIAVATILIIAEMGWGVVHRRVWQHLYYVPLEIALGGKTVKIDALLDTGNRLQDPLTGRPVIVVELDQMVDLLPARVVESIRQFNTGFGSIDTLADELGWEARFCLVPFSTVGSAKGLMPGFRPDYVTVTAGGQQFTLPRVIVGLCQDPLDRSGSFHGLVPQDVLGTTKYRRTAEPAITERRESLNA